MVALPLHEIWIMAVMTEQCMFFLQIINRDHTDKWQPWQGIYPSKSKILSESQSTSPLLRCGRPSHVHSSWLEWSGDGIGVIWPDVSLSMRCQHFKSFHRISKCHWGHGIALTASSSLQILGPQSDETGHLWSTKTRQWQSLQQWV